MKVYIVNNSWEADKKVYVTSAWDADMKVAKVAISHANALSVEIQE